MLDHMAIVTEPTAYLLSYNFVSFLPCFYTFALKIRKNSPSSFAVSISVHLSAWATQKLLNPLSWNLTMGNFSRIYQYVLICAKSDNSSGQIYKTGGWV